MWVLVYIGLGLFLRLLASEQTTVVRQDELVAWGGTSMDWSCLVCEKEPKVHTTAGPGPYSGPVISGMFRNI